MVPELFAVVSLVCDTWHGDSGTKPEHNVCQCSNIIEVYNISRLVKIERESIPSDELLGRVYCIIHDMLVVLLL